MGAPKKKEAEAACSESFLTEMVDTLIAKAGEGTAQLLGSDGMAIKIRGVLSTQCPTIDAAIGRGGVPLGRLTIVHGSEGCIAEGAMIPVNRAGKGGKFKIEHVVKMFNGGVAGGKKWDPKIPTFVRAMQPDNTVRLAKLKGAYESGRKTVFEVRTKGRRISATSDHPFWKEGCGWVGLGKLKVGDQIAVENGRPEKRGGEVQKKRKDKRVFITGHPFASCSRNGHGYIVWFHRFVYEANANGLSVAEFAKRIRKGDLEGLEFFDPAIFVVHHRNGDWRDNRPENLELMTHENHRRIHTLDWAKNIEVPITFEKIESIKEIGERPTYDLEIDLESPNGQANFVANGFVVHNSGKTTLALHLVAECQRQGGVAIYIDKEYKLDPDYARGIGVDVGKLIISQPPYLEKCLAIIDEAIQRVARRRFETGVRVPLLIILDSMNAAISKDMYDGDWEDQTMASVARVYSQKLPKLMEKVSQEDVALVFISQVREKVGVVFGNKEDICGGRAPKFHASLILEVIRKGSMKGEEIDGAKKEEGEEEKKKAKKEFEIIGNLNEVYVRKNQIAPPFKRAEFEVIYGKGIDFSGSLIRRAQILGVLEKVGNTYATSMEGEKVGVGFAAARARLDSDDGLRELIAERVRCASPWVAGS